MTSYHSLLTSVLTTAGRIDGNRQNIYNSTSSDESSDMSESDDSSDASESAETDSEGWCAVVGLSLDLMTLNFVQLLCVFIVKLRIRFFRR